MKSQPRPETDMRVSAEVAEAIRTGKPVVALESALITHGLPQPANLETALAMEAAVRESGAVPATIAILGGTLTVGLDRSELEALARAPKGTVRKCSRRDFPIAIGRGETAGTTVAGTLIAAHRAGISVLATGGIGGVHRGAPFDVSADLIELGRTPMTVVCSGAKSILDLPATLEVLETQGVTVVGLGTGTFPGFYTRDTGLPVDATVEGPAQAAAIAAAARRLGSTQAVIIAVPVPRSHELPPGPLEEAIARAVAEAAAEGVRGKAVTPFLLRRVAELSGGASQRANIALLVNNARVAGQVASALLA